MGLFSIGLDLKIGLGLYKYLGKRLSRISKIIGLRQRAEVKEVFGIH